MGTKTGKRTFEFSKDIFVMSCGNVVGKFEGEGPLSKCFDLVIEDEYFGEKTYEKAETKLQKHALNIALQKALINISNVDVIASGDLLNQCISSTYSVRNNNIPYIGLFGACSTMTLSTIIAAMTIECGYSEISAGITSSHFCTAERQFRQPLEYGGQSTPSSQRTVTAGACVLLSDKRSKVKLKRMALGSVVDFLINDANNMGAAMAPAAADTLLNYFNDTNTNPDDYEMILTGDLGVIGSGLLRDLMSEKNCELGQNYNDCGCLIFDNEKQKTNAGGSGCGCSGAVLTGYVLPKMFSGELNKVLFMSTGALMSPTASMQGESIPGVAHVMEFERVE